MNNESLKIRAKEVLEKYSINTLNEKKLLEILMDFGENDQIDIEFANKTLDYIEKYLLAKEKLNVIESDSNFLKNLAEKLREQSIRRTDISNPPLFKVKDGNNQEIYFLTRGYMENYLKMIGRDSQNVKPLVEIPSDRNVELSILLEIIKRNF